jgi:hypothetical protein
MNKIEVDYTAVKLRAYLSKDQKFTLNQWCGSMRFIWNKFLEIKNRRYKKWVDQGKPKDFDWRIDFQWELEWLRHDFPWLEDVPQTAIIAGILFALQWTH